MYPVTAQVGYGLDPAQAVFQRLHVSLQFPVGLVFRFQGDQQGGSIAEIIIRDDGEYARGQLRLEVLQAELDLRPDLVFIVHVVVQLHHHVHHSIP